MTTLNEIKNEIKSIAEDITGIGNVYDRLVYAKDQAQLKELFVKSGSDGSVLNSLMFRQVKRVVNPDSENYDEILIERTWEFTLIYGYNKEANSEQSFDNLCELICQTYNSNEDLNSKVQERTGFMDMMEKEDLMYHNIICHSAKFIMITRN